MLTEKKQKDLDFVKEKIGKYLPLLLIFLKEKKTLLKYSEDLFSTKTDQTYLKRQKYLIEIIKQKMSESFSQKEIDEMDLDFDSGIISNIVDHHNILNHPILVSGLIISSLYHLLDNKTKSLFVLTCGDVPLNNFFHKRGFTFKDKLFTFFTSKDTHKIIYGMPKRKLNFLDLAKERNMLDGLDEKEKEFLENYQKIIDEIDLEKCKDFIDEITRINYSIFKLMFAQDIRDKIPKLIDFNAEYLASRMLGKIDKESFLYKSVFDPEFRKVVLKEFEGIWGAWNTDKGLGTHFFWLMLPNSEQAELVCDGEYLKAKDERIDFKIKIEEKEICEMLEKKILVPNLFLSYGAIIFYFGVKPLTGLGSMNYLTDMQNAWIRALASDYPEEQERIKKMSMKSLICSPVVTYGRNKNGNIEPQFFADIVFNGGLTKEYLENLSKMKFGDLMEMSLIDNYDVKVPQSEKKDLEITTADLTSDKFSWIK